MRPPSSLLAAAGVLLLAAAGATGAITLTSSDFSATSTNTGNTFTATTQPNTAPVVSAAVIGRSGSSAAGSIAKSKTFYVYANATDDTAVSTVKATLTNVTGSATAVTLTAGTWTAPGGTSYGYRSAVLTSSSTLTAGAKSFTVTATDGSALSHTFTGSVTADITVPTGASILTTNKAGGTAGRVEMGDTISFGFSENVEPDSVLSGWDGTATDVMVGVFNNSSGNDTLIVYRYDTSSTPIELGVVNLGSSGAIGGSAGTYVGFGVVGTGTASSITMSGATATVTLGSVFGSGGGTVATNTTATLKEIWTPDASVLDLAGNAMSTATRTATTGHKVF